MQIEVLGGIFHGNGLRLFLFQVSQFGQNWT